MLGTILIVFAFVLACLASYGVPAGRWQLGWAALAFYFASILFNAGGHLLR
jgi:Na+/H+-dicarboxylate symporter